LPQISYVYSLLSRLDHHPLFRLVADGAQLLRRVTCECRVDFEVVSLHEGRVARVLV